MDPDAAWQGSPEAAPGKAVEVGGRLRPADRRPRGASLFELGGQALSAQHGSG
jgi:hypothetical protein